MRNAILRLRVLGQILKQEHGQDLIEYALVVALIAFGAVAGMQTVAGNINTAFQQIGQTLVTNTNVGAS